MTDYQKSVAEHMAAAPVELKEYVCGRLKENSYFEEDDSPISNCGFVWRDSKEGRYFWGAISRKQWQDAISTEFWQSRTQQNFQPQQYPQPQQDALTPISEMEIGQVFAFGTGRWKIVSVENGQAQCERLPDVITLPITQQVPAE